MKIGIIILHCDIRKSSRYVMELSNRFVKKHEVHIFTNEWNAIFDKNIQIHRIPTIKVTHYPRELLFTLLSSLRLSIEKFDVTLAQPTRYFHPDIAEMQFVYKAWGDYRRKNNMYVNKMNLFVYWMEKRNLRKAKRVIAISKSVKNEVIKYHGIPEKKIDVIYSGVNADQFKPNKKYREEIRKKLKISPKENLIIFVGNPFERKGLKYLIEAMRNIDAKLLIMGRDPTQPEYEKLVRKLDLDKKVMFGGFTKEIEKYFAAADAFVFPTLYEPFGLVITEAMASGLPVVTSRIAGAGELIREGKDGFLLNNPKDPIEIAEKAKKALKKKRTFGENARERAKEFTWDKVSKRYLNVLEEVGKHKI
ncbi:MAG: glycosyltransferase family 4 protein [Candidatus Aenigmarchaeota archaeon]|nr:glycosyltransferase family 4 protein [Candidatus Aenigmarchaeota archaeon]